MGKQVFLIISCILLLSSCSWFGKKAPQDVPSSTGASASGSQYSPKQSTHTIYYDFKDIKVPKEMELLPKESLIFETPSFKAGVIMFEGRVEPVSLFNFFINNMPQDGWKLRSYYKYGRYIMVYEKQNRDCIISLHERTLNTQLQIWVTPRANTPYSQEEELGPEATTLTE